VLHEPKGLFPEHEDLHEQPLFYVEPKDKLPDSEEKRQKRMIAELRRQGVSVWHNAQSGRRSDYERTTLHRNGSVAGVPDLSITWAGRGSYFAEVKSGTGSPSRAQIEFLNARTREGFPCGVHRTWETLEACLIAAGAPITRTKAETPVGDAARNVILRLIEIEQDPSERKAKIMIAREDGHLSDAETEAWIARDGLRFA
jgi:hypothetical protein